MEGSSRYILGMSILVIVAQWPSFALPSPLRYADSPAAAPSLGEDYRRTNLLLVPSSSDKVSELSLIASFNV